MTAPLDSFDVGSHPETSEILDALAQAVRVGLRTHVPARVVTYDPATQLATVQVEHRTVVRLRSVDDLPTGAELVGAPPTAKAVLPPQIVQMVPVIFAGTATAYLTVPIVPGTTGTLHVHDRSLDAWMTKGAPCDPLMAWTHVLESSEFHPGLHPRSAALPTTDLTATVLDGPMVKLGRSAALAAARETDTLTASGKLATWASGVEAALVAAASPVAATFVSLGLGSPGELGVIASGSAKVKVE